jgi:hypothetical protein
MQKKGTRRKRVKGAPTRALMLVSCWQWRLV